MITHAEQHRRAMGKGEWRSAHSIVRCSRYFGDLACCVRLIEPGQRYFDTQETVPDAGILRSFKVCAKCANSPVPMDFLKERNGMSISSRVPGAAGAGPIVRAVRARGDRWIDDLPAELFTTHAVNGIYEYQSRGDHVDFWRNKACLSADAATRRFWREDLIISENRADDEGAVFSGRKTA